MSADDSGLRDAVAAAVAALAADRLVAFPTETVWGLAARAASETATARLFAWKRRAADHPVSVLVEDAAGLATLEAEVSPLARDLSNRFWPGPLTLILRCRVSLAPGIAGEGGAVGVRCSPHPVAASLVQSATRAGLGPLTATSFNRAGEPPADNVGQARKLAKAGESDAASPYLLARPGLDASGLEPSTVLDLCGERPRIVRLGAISVEALQSVRTWGWDA